MNTLHTLADRAGILPGYRDQMGRPQETRDETRVAILHALGFDASSESARRAALEAWDARERSRLLEPVRVMPAGTPVGVSVPAALAGTWTLRFEPEAGEPVERSGGPEELAQGLVVGTVPPGYHRIHLTTDRGEAEQLLVVHPERCPTVQELTGRDRLTGVFANLYTVQSGQNWGIGDLGDLGKLLQWVAASGGAFLGINPLHALRNRGHDISPYSPVSRTYRNPIYLDVPRIPIFAESSRAASLLDSPILRRRIEELREAPLVEYEAVMQLKRQVLELLFPAFLEHCAAGSPRGQAFEAYLAGQGEALERFATFEALADHLGHDRWREWPPEFRDAGSDAVRAFRESHRPAIRFHQWLQFELDQQLAGAALTGRSQGLALGLYTDLAIGTSTNGADLWLDPGLFVDGVSLGAPPDDYAADGQNWGLPPINPAALRADCYAYWIRLLRSAFAHAGALRIDHVLGLFRQFWIPRGMSGAQGAYLRFPTDDLLGILTLEAARHRALVVGEDLGTVPPEVPPTLRRFGILSSRVFCFERTGLGFRPALEYEPLALTTVNTHDMPPFASYLAGRDIQLKRQAGMLESDAREQEEHQRRQADRDAMLRRLRAEGILPEGAEPDDRTLLAMVHEFLCRTPSALVAFNLDDLLDEREPVNLPGTHPEQFPAWRRKLTSKLESFTRDPLVPRLMRCSRESGRGPEGMEPAR